MIRRCPCGVAPQDDGLGIGGAAAALGLRLDPVAVFRHGQAQHAPGLGVSAAGGDGVARDEAGQLGVGGHVVGLVLRRGEQHEVHGEGV